MVTTPPQQFCVRWNSYQSNLQNAFPKLLTSEHFVDVTLACENEMLKCHKVVLSACSTYFEKLLLQNPCQHPIIFMKDMKFQEVQSLVDFMYKGEVNVTQHDLPSLLKSAEALQIRGLCGSDQLLSQGFQNVKSPTQNNAPAPVTQQSQTPTKPTNGSVEKPLTNSVPKQQLQQHLESTPMKPEEIKHTTETAQSDGGLNPSSSDCDSNDALHIKEDHLDVKEELVEDDSYYEGDGESIMDSYMEEDGNISMNNMSIDDMKSPDFAIANVSCQYDGSPGASNRRIRRSDEELRRAAECITRGQTFQTVSDQFNIPISTIRFYMARKGILPRRKRGRACSGPSSGGGPTLMSSSGSSSSHFSNTGTHNTYGGASGGGGGGGGATSAGHNNSGNTSPIGPPYHIVHYKLPQLGVSKLK